MSLLPYHTPAGKNLEGDDLARHLGTQLLRRRLSLRVDRLNKKPLPGSKRMVKFPRKLAYLPGDLASVSARQAGRLAGCRCNAVSPCWPDAAADPCGTAPAPATQRVYGGKCCGTRGVLKAWILQHEMRTSSPALGAGCQP